MARLRGLEPPAFGSGVQRIFFKYKWRLLGDLCRCALRALTRYFETAAGTTVKPGVIAAIQTFGDRINFHPHLHFLAAEGGLDAAGVFHAIPRIDDARLAELFYPTKLEAERVGSA